MPPVNSRLVGGGVLSTPKPPVRPAPLHNAFSSSSARRRRSRSSGGGGGGGGGGGDAANANVKPAETPEPQSQSVRIKQLAAAMTRPATSGAALKSFQLLRSLLPRRFAELCKVHLSFVIDVPADFLDDDEDDKPAGGQTQWLWQRARDSMKLKRIQNVAAPPAASSVSDLGMVDLLLTRLTERTGVEQVEGLFRKCGSVARQRRLLDSLLTGCDSGVRDDNGSSNEVWTLHDLAGALKVSLSRLSEPLLTRRLLPYFQQVARTDQSASAATSTDHDDSLSAVLTARRLKALRLLIQLLPHDRRNLLGRLLALLSAVAAAVAVSRMTPDNLGTVFGPALFYPTPETDDAVELAPIYNSALAFVIRHADAVMEVPDSVAQDADGILRRLRRDAVVNDAALADETAMPCLSVRFAELADTAASAAAAAPTDELISSTSAADEFTRSQVAALYAAVQAMPDSAKRRRLIRRFNRTNGGLPVSCGQNMADSSASPSPSPSSFATATTPSPLISSPVFGRLFDYPMRCLSPDTTGR